MADNCSLEIVNATSQLLVVTHSHAYQMDTWSFANVGSMNYASFPVSFFNGSHDEDDGAEQNYAYSGPDLIQIQARSDDHSNHYLNVQSLGTAPSTIVLVTNGSGNVYDPTIANQLSWMSVSSAGGGVLIGKIPTNQTFLGLGVVDLARIFSDPNEVRTFVAAIDSGNLSNAQAVTLSAALDKAIQGKVGAPSLAGASR